MLSSVKDVPSTDSEVKRNISHCAITKEKTALIRANTFFLRVILPATLVYLRRNKLCYSCNVLLEKHESIIPIMYDIKICLSSRMIFISYFLLPNRILSYHVSIKLYLMNYFLTVIKKQLILNTLLYCFILFYSHIVLFIVYQG